MHLILIRKILTILQAFDTATLDALGTTLTNIQAALDTLDPEAITALSDIYARQGAPAGVSQSADVAAVKAETALIYARSGAPAGASLAADIAAAKAVVDLIKTAVDSMTPEVMDRLGAPAGASLAADIALAYARLGTVGGPDFDDVYLRLGAPVGADLSADIAAAKAVLDTALTAIQAMDPEVMDRLGAPAGASMSADVAAIKAVVDAVNTAVATFDPELFTLLGTPFGASLAADILTIHTEADTTKNVAFDIQQKWNSIFSAIKLVAPSLADGGTLTTDAGAGWAYGVYTELLAAAAMATTFRVVGVNVEALTTATAQFQIDIAAGPGAGEVVIGTIRGAGVGYFPLGSAVVAANARIAARWATAVGLSDTCKVSIVYAAAVS